MRKTRVGSNYFANANKFRVVISPVAILILKSDKILIIKIITSGRRQERGSNKPESGQFELEKVQILQMHVRKLNDSKDMSNFLYNGEVDGWGGGHTRVI